MNLVSNNNSTVNICKYSELQIEPQAKAQRSGLYSGRPAYMFSRKSLVDKEDFNPYIKPSYPQVTLRYQNHDKDYQIVYIQSTASFSPRDAPIRIDITPTHLTYGEMLDT